MRPQALWRENMVAAVIRAAQLEAVRRLAGVEEVAVNKSSSHGLDVSELQNRELEWADAIFRKDRAALEDILADEYVLRTAIGNIPRADWLRDGVGAMDHKAIEVLDQHVSVYGDVAVAQCRLYWHVVRGEKMPPDPRTGSREVRDTFIVTDVWIRRDGRWQVAHRHSTIALPPSQSPASPRPT